MTSRSRLVAPVVLVTAGALALAGCGGGAEPQETPADGTVNVVASTNVYGQIAEAIGGDHVAVTSIVTSGAQDPHSFEASARDQLAVSDAQLIIENGGGYDSFMDALIDGSGADAPVITAVEFSHDWPDAESHDEAHPEKTHADDAHADDDGHAEDDHAHAEETHAAEDEHADDAHADDGHDHGDHGHVEGFNEHVWYDPHTIAHVAEAIADELSELDAANADAFADNLAEFTAGIETIEASLADLDTEYAGTQILVTEPVPLYLTDAAGLVNVMPAAFTEAVEEGQDVAPATLLEAQRLVASGDIALVIANAQTGGAETTQVISDAEGHGIPIVEFTETLPEGQTYLSWMTANVDALAEALTP